MSVQVARTPKARRTATTPLGRLDVILADSGIGRDRFAEAAAAAISELQAGAGPKVDAPATQFGEADRASLEAGGLDLAPRRAADSDWLAESAARYAALLADSEDVGEVAGRLGVTRARIRQRALERSLLAIREHDEWRFPRAQFAEAAPIRGLPAVSMAIPLDLHPIATWRFLTEPNVDLELDDEAVSPLDWLRSGGSPAPVVAIARDL